ncbi:MAG TPA: helix-turn-helix domain-containing protein [Thermoanaerobaculia bacterium]|jgi:DNA-binding HxlR family transcriptional regulator|nr:helix-turn-helix domain-containing protein [Thermoanaerobaculia bacterium]
MASPAPSSRPVPRSACPIANALDLLGDRWTLLVIRDLLFAGKHRFGDFLSSPEGIPTNILSDRLRRLEETGVVTRVPYQQRPERYEYQLTAKGRDLFPVLRALVDWARSHLPGVASPPPGVLERYEEKLRELSAPASDSEEPQRAAGCPEDLT